MVSRRAVVTGASSGIGRASVVALIETGWQVTGVARRADRLEQLAAETGADVFAADLTKQQDVDALVEHVGVVNALVNIAGGAIGADPVERANAEDWAVMFDMNVLTALRLTKALLPALRRGVTDGAGHADLLFVTSTAAQLAYPGGGGYNAAKAAEAMLAHALRLELNGEPIRVTEVAPGMVKTDEFTLNRLAGDTAAADAVYADVDHPLTDVDVADVIAYALGAPGHVNLDLITMRPVAQSAQHLLHRGPLAVKPPKENE
ncbi:MAG: SDR family oxidoreductase [Microbacterium sp.]